MTGLAVIAGRTAESLSLEAIHDAINPLANLEIQTARGNQLLACVGQHEQAPCASVSFDDRGSVTCLLAGDVVNKDELDWLAIHSALASGDRHPDCLRRLRGSFAIVVIDRDRNRLWAVTDPSAWQSVMTCETDHGYIVSTSFAAILRALPGAAKPNDDWIFESLYFNHGSGLTTPVSGVERLPPGTITEVELNSFAVTRTLLQPRPTAHRPLINGQEAVNEAIDTFRAVVPRYFPDDTPVTIGISEGLDCRTVLASLPGDKIKGLHSFTFGMSTSSEIEEAAEIADSLGLNHTPVLLDKPFLERLPELARDTVFLSQGQQNINRSHLLYTYGRLQHAGRPYPVLMTGVSGDHIFRDHIQGWGNVPHILSAAAASQFRNGRQKPERDYYSPLFGPHYEAFENCIEQSLDSIQEEFGEFHDPETYLSYLMFEAGPRYFGGQTAIANHFSTFRTPYWDPEIIRLGYRLHDATLGFSESMKTKDLYKETHIQSAIIAAHETVSALPYKGLPINVYARESRMRYQSHRLLRKVRSMIHHTSFIYSEDWQLWYRTIMDNEVQRTLGDDARIRNYVTAEFIEKSIADADVHWIGKLMTTEYTLRLIENGWRRLAD